MITQDLQVTDYLRFDPDSEFSSLKVGLGRGTLTVGVKKGVYRCPRGRENTEEKS